MTSGTQSWPWEGIWGDSPSSRKEFLPTNSILSQEVKPAVFFPIYTLNPVCVWRGVQVDHQRGSHCLKQKPVLTGWLGVRGWGPRSEKKKRTETEGREVEFRLPKAVSPFPPRSSHSPHSAWFMSYRDQYREELMVSPDTLVQLYTDPSLHLVVVE